MHDHTISIQFIAFAIFDGDLDNQGTKLGDTVQYRNANATDSNFGILKIEIRFISDTT
jgi:hypothetical protein